MLQNEKPRRVIPAYEGTLRANALRVPGVIRECSGILIFGRRIKAIVFTTDLCVLRNIDADAVLAVYPFTPQPAITHAVLTAAGLDNAAAQGAGWKLPDGVL